MRCRLFAFSVACAALVAGCTTTLTPAQFWRPISEPNVLMPLDELQRKLVFDLSQCTCGIFPANTPHDVAIKYQADKQRLVQTSVTIMPDEETGACKVQPSLVVSECMRYRGWEPTRCAGRMPTQGGGAVCALYDLTPNAD